MEVVVVADVVAGLVVNDVVKYVGGAFAVDECVD